MLTYAAAGVDYDPLDAFKRACQKHAAGTQHHLHAHGASAPTALLGESVYLIELPDQFLAHVEEALGTKSKIADIMLEQTGQSHYRAVAIDDVSTIVNDLIVCGARALSVCMYAGVGDSAYFSHERRCADLAEGFAEGCRLAGAAWAGGETQTLKGLIAPDALVLGGSAIGRISPKSHRIAVDVKAGDDIILLASSGVHTNGLTLCRALADRLPQGYGTPITPGGKTYGEALLEPSIIYSRAIAALQDAGIALHYAVHLTGHGWRKLMRAPQNLLYRIDRLPPLPDLFKFIMQHAELDAREAYGTFNMGVGFVLYLDPRDTPRAIKIIEAAGIMAWRGGRVLDANGRKGVELTELNLTYDADSLHIR